jgi:hypothetical protein
MTFGKFICSAQGERSETGFRGRRRCIAASELSKSSFSGTHRCGAAIHLSEKLIQWYALWRSHLSFRTCQAVTVVGFTTVI